MWEMEGRTTEEIATALNTSPANVRHILVRARKSMVRVLEDWIVDEKTGLTALNALSTTYKKTVEIAQKSSKAALSLLLVITAFLGFNSMTGNEGVPALTTPEAVVSAGTTPSESASPTASASATAKAQAAAKKAQQAAINAKIAALSFFGLDNQGIPSSFTVTDKDSIFGKARVTKGTTSLTNAGLVINNQFITGSVGPNILMDQTVTVDGSGTNYSANSLYVGFAGNWVSVAIKSVDSSVERLSNGQFLVTSTLNLGDIQPTEYLIPTGNRGYDVNFAPSSITTRLLLNNGKTQVLAQATQVMNN
jgi:uncharacterized lipoprotein NlpE involved in copper resistance